MHTFYDAPINAGSHGIGVIQLSEKELNVVSGGMSSSEAGNILKGFAVSVATGATIGAVAGGPGGMLAGAIIGGARAAVAAGIGALSYGAYSSSGGGKDISGKTSSE